MNFHSDFEFLASKGMVIPDGQVILPSQDILASDRIAMDANPTLTTTVNAGIPAFMTTYVDPNLIEVVFSPMRGAEIAGEMKKGDFVTQTAIFPMVEATGEVSSYGDWNNNGEVSVNTNFPDRQSYHYQAFARWGERQVEMAAEARIQYVAQLRASAALKLNKFQNQSYFYGIEGLRNYGYLNDPALSAAIVPGTKTAGGTSWDNATSLEITKDVVAIIQQLRKQSAGYVTTESRITIGLSPTRAGLMTMPNEFGLSAWDQIKKQYKNVEFIEAVEFGDMSGETVQTMIAVADEIDGQQVATAAFTEKLRTHTVIPEASAWYQKLSQGTWGAIIYVPAGVATMSAI